MLERSRLAANALECLHNEDYDRPFNTQSLNHETMIFMGGRTTETLNGPWNFTTDILDTGLRQRWYALKPGPRSEPWDYDPFEGERIPVPSCWNLENKRWYFFEGSGWYTRFVDIAEIAADERLFLRVGAASYDCKVFVNNTFVGNHYGASTPFFAELTGHLHAGRNWISLCVNASRTLDRVPMRNTDWFNYGGVHRDVELIRTPRTLIRDLFVRLAEGRTDAVAVTVTVDGDADTAIIGIPEAGIEVAVALEGGRGTTTVDWMPELWSPDSPRLYDVVAECGGDRVSDRVGFRSFRREGTNILLNGEPVFLRGISVHEDDVETGRCASEADIRRRFRHAKELNANFLRLAHYPHHEQAARIADEEGLLLWEEIPVYWAIDFENPETFRDASNQLRELILRDRNRASVVFWGVGNENADTDARLKFMGDLVSICREMDPTRLVSAACLVNHATCRIEDRLAGHLDAIGINEYYGWYEERFEDLEDIGRNSEPDRPVIITETGADALSGPDGPREGLFSEAYQREVYEKQLAILSGLDWIKGMSPWILYDFRTERRCNIYQRGFNRKGLIAEDKETRKPAFAVLRDFYARWASGTERP